ncbi:MAG: glycosyltransferase [Flavobacteriales bacterium]|nr:glycosyltransferase [Flavobacteriales bacterium]
MHEKTALFVTDPLVSACIISYAQEGFIGKTLESILHQKTDFKYEIVIADDHSPDSTAEMIEKSVSEYDGNACIKILKKEPNLGMHRNWERAILSCKGKYIALCEGDDVWNDPQKLEKQIDLLENDSSAVACFSNANVLKEDGIISEYPYVDKGFTNLIATDFFSNNFNPIPTCTLVFRRSAFTGFPPQYHKSPFADWILHSLLIQQGNYIYLPETTSTYRQHDGGVWSGIKEEKQLLNKYKALQLISGMIGEGYRPQITAAIGKQLDELLYLYRENSAYLKFFRTWLRLKQLGKSG